VIETIQQFSEKGKSFEEKISKNWHCQVNWMRPSKSLFEKTGLLRRLGRLGF
jgi:hypothetical protein